MNVKNIVVLFGLLCVVVPLTFAVMHKETERMSYVIREPAVDTKRMGMAAKPVTFDTCGLCVQTLGQIINQLLNIILQGGVIGSCAALCSMVPGGQLVQTACNLLCDVVGIEAFIELVKKADLNPIWMCQELTLCPIHDCKSDVCAKWLDTTISPASGPKGSTFHIAEKFQVLEQTGTGSLEFEIIPIGVPPFGDGELVPEGFKPGVYDIALNVQIKDNPQSDPPVHFQPGVYKTVTAVCEGLCGSHHAHTRVLCVGSGNFTVTA